MSSTNNEELIVDIAQKLDTLQQLQELADLVLSADSNALFAATEQMTPAVEAADQELKEGLDIIERFDDEVLAFYKEFFGGLARVRSEIDHMEERVRVVEMRHDDNSNSSGGGDNDDSDEGVTSSADSS